MANLKLLVPTYRTRQRFVTRALSTLAREGRFRRALHLGTGEGDYDRLVRAHVDALVACDISREDVRFARRLNDGVGVSYTVADAQRLPFSDESFDLVVTVDVIEHVPDSRAMAREVARVLKPGGRALLTCPITTFPWTYDPVNRALQRLGTHVPAGAYAYGHDKLMERDELERWLAEDGLHVDARTPLSGPLTGLVESYWAGFAQKLMKANAKNQDAKASGLAVRPDDKEPPGVAVVDRLIALDEKLTRPAGASVGVGYLLTRAGAERRSTTFA